MAGIIFTEGQQVIVRGLNDELVSAGTFIGVTEYGQAIVEVTVRDRHNGEVVATDTYYTRHSLSNVYAVEED